MRGRTIITQVTRERRMRRIRYSVATSLDGYIAGPNGEYDWIELDPSAGAAYFKAFDAQFDTVLMGRKSYEQAGGGVAPFKTYVFAHVAPGKRGDVTVLGSDALERIAALREEPGRTFGLGWRGAFRQSGSRRPRRHRARSGRSRAARRGSKVMAGCERRVEAVQRPPDLELPVTPSVYVETSREERSVARAAPWNLLIGILQRRSARCGPAKSWPTTTNPCELVIPTIERIGHAAKSFAKGPRAQTATPRPRSGPIEPRPRLLCVQEPNATTPQSLLTALR